MPCCRNLASIHMHASKITPRSLLSSGALRMLMLVRLGNEPQREIKYFSLASIGVREFDLSANRKVETMHHWLAIGSLEMSMNSLRRCPDMSMAAC